MNFNNFTNLNQFGWHPFFEAYFNEYSGNGYSAGRVAVENKNNYILYTEYGELLAEISGKLFYEISGKGDFPAVGDWVVFRALPGEQKAVIDHVLPRKTKFSRKSAGAKTEEQVIASNIDNLFIMSSLNQDFNPRRIERYLTLAWESEAAPVILLSKSDLCKNPGEKKSETESIAFGVPVHCISTLKITGLEKLKQYFSQNQTGAIVGSSGVGKSTLINTLLGENKLKVNDTADYKDKGLHTTTRRELILLPDGGMIIDTPGMRELQLWDGNKGVGDVFEDIETIASECRFKDCKHENEPGCAVREALRIGNIDAGRYKSYQKLQREVRYFERRSSENAILAEKRKWKKIHKEAKKIMKMKGR
jgi:ribosome biogenesis GTPase